VTPALYFGRVMHARLRPRRNTFRYRVFFLRLPLSKLSQIFRSISEITALATGRHQSHGFDHCCGVKAST